MKFFLQISEYLSLLLLMPLLMSCDPFPTESVYPSHCYSLEILNDTEFPVRIHMNFDLENNSVYTIGENSVIINKGESYSFIRDRFFESNTNPFKTAWKGISSNKLYLEAYVYSYESSQDVSLVQQWNNQSENNELFQEEYWILKEWDNDPSDKYNIHHFVWTFTLSNNNDTQ